MQIPPGGPATINGILYQVLWCLSAASRLHIRANDITSDGLDGSHAQLILEPSAGGDVIVHGDRVEKVVQLKSKSDAGSWSLRDFVESVLPDLYRSVQEDIPQRYVLVTEGHRGEWSNAVDFFASLGKRAIPPEEAIVLDSLNTNATISYSGLLTGDKSDTGSISERNLFDLIAKRIQQKAPANAEAEDTVHRKLWKLLANLGFEWRADAASIRRGLDQYFLPLINHAEELDKTIGAMLMDLAQSATRGDAVIEPSEFFARHNIEAVPLTNWSRLVSRGQQRLHESFHSLPYCPEEDVRGFNDNAQLAAWHDGSKPCLVISGESGQGKSWKLSALAGLVSLYSPVVLFRSTRGRDRDEAERNFSVHLWGQDQVISLESVAARIKEVMPDMYGPWLYVFIDDVQDYTEVEQLIGQIPFDSGIRLAMTTSIANASRIVARQSNFALNMPVGDFIEAEARQCVSGDDIGAWYDIPEDVRNLLKRPLFAGLYKDITTDQWQPNSEYELISRYTDERYRDPVEYERPTCLTAMQKAVLGLWDGGAYPWPIDDLLAHGLDDEGLRYLTKIGWLQRDDDDRYRVWHDRMLAWQIAVVIARDLASGARDVAAVAKKCAELLFGNEQHQISTLEYVPMDIVWLLAERGEQASEVLDGFIAGLERDYIAERSLYASLLPTIGQKIVPAILRRIEKSDSPQKQSTVFGMAEAVAKFDSEKVFEGAQRLIESQDSLMRRAGMEIIERRPFDSAFEPLFTLYTDIISYEGVDHDAKEQFLMERLDLMPALRSCAPLVPDWIEKQILASTLDQVGLGTLAQLLTELPDGDERWLRVKGILRNNLKEDDRYSYANNVSFWRDKDETEWLLEEIKNGLERNRDICFRALLRTDPDAALELLGTLKPINLYSTRKWTFAPLSARFPEETAQRMTELIRTRPDDRWTYAQVFSDMPDLLPSSALEILLDDLLKLLKDKTLRQLYRCLMSLASFNRIGLLKILWKRDGTEFDEALTNRILEFGARPGKASNIESRDAVTILYKLGGSGFTSAINQWLTSDSLYGRYDGYSAARKRSNASTRDLLLEIATEKREVTSGRSEVFMAGRSLAQIGEWTLTIEHILTSNEIEQATLYSRWDCERLDDDLMARVIEVFEKDSQNRGALMALGFGGRNEFAERVAEVLQNAGEDSNLINACLWSLHLMKDITSKAVATVSARLGTFNCDWLAVPTLENQGSDEAVAGLFDHFRSLCNEPSPGAFSVGDATDLSRLATYLVRQPGVSEEVSLLCRSRIDHWLEPDYYTEEFVRGLCSNINEPAIESILDCPRIITFLEEEAFTRDEGTHYVGNKARSIRSLGFYDPKSAYSAALRTLMNPDSHDRDRMPEILLELAEDEAVSDLFTHAQATSSLTMRTSIARALGRREVTEPILSLLKSPDAGSRETACMLLGYAEPIDKVVQSVRSCLDDIHEDVYEAAFKSIHQLDAALTTNELVDAFLVEEDSSRRWILLDAALGTGDPGDENSPPPEWCLKLTKGMSRMLETYAWDRLDKKRKEVTKTITDEERRSNW